jgi:Flp pilus assembly protein CpaB
MINRGDRVDIIGIIAGGDTAEPRSLFVLQNIEVLALGTSLSPPSAGAAPPATITLSVDPQSALKLKMAVQSGNISFLLRPSVDNNLVTTVPVTVSGF